MSLRLHRAHAAWQRRASAVLWLLTSVCLSTLQDGHRSDEDMWVSGKGLVSCVASNCPFSVQRLPYQCAMQTALGMLLLSRHRAKQGWARATAARLELAAHTATHGAHTTPLRSPEDGRLLTFPPERNE